MRQDEVADPLSSHSAEKPETHAPLASDPKPVLVDIDGGRSVMLQYPLVQPPPQGPGCRFVR